MVLVNRQTGKRPDGVLSCMSTHPYAWRTWLRSHSPWFLIDLGFARKGEDCQSVGAEHSWYNIDDESSGCYYCRVVCSGRLWR